MPAKTDWVGRAHELKVRYILQSNLENKSDLDRVLLKLKRLYPRIYSSLLKRINIGAKHTVYYIQRNIVKNKKIKIVEYKGEENKGISDVDLIIKFFDGDKSEISLKLYKTKTFNLWNPTLETLFLHLTGLRFSEYLNKKELSKYLNDMKSLKDILIKSELVAATWVKKAAEILKKFYEGNSSSFRKRLIEKLGCASIIIAPIVDNDGEFKKLVVTQPDLIKLLARGGGKLGITSNGISIRITIDGKLLTNFSVYAQSGSKGRSGGLRIATWTPYF